MRRAFITGTAGFIGFHLAEHLLQNGWEVAGLDGMTDYYDMGPMSWMRRRTRWHRRVRHRAGLLPSRQPLSDTAIRVSLWLKWCATVARSRYGSRRCSILELSARPMCS